MGHSNQRGAGHSNQRGAVHSSRAGESYVIDMLPKVKLVTVLSDENVETVIRIMIEAGTTGVIGDGKILVGAIEDALRVRTGSRQRRPLASDSTAPPR